MNTTTTSPAPRAEARSDSKADRPFPITRLSEAEATARGLENWIGTFGRGRYSINATTTKTERQAIAWVHKVTGDNPVKVGAWVWETTDWKGVAIGWSACFE